MYNNTDHPRTLPPAPPSPVRAYAIGFLAFFGTAVAAVVMGIRSPNEAGRLRALAMFVGAIGGGLFFGAAYTALRRLGVEWHAYVNYRHRSGILTRDQNPLLYWGILVGVLILSCGLVVLAGWAWFNADAIVGHFAQQRRT